MHAHDLLSTTGRSFHFIHAQSGRPDLLCRCAAGADLAPNNASCIIVCGGYGLRHPDMVAYDYYNDIVVIDTQRWVPDLQSTPKRLALCQ
eukprot:scaffold161526_cov17-Tisochrysis_lutea.AAC.1